MMTQNMTPVVIDYGSAMLKGGISGDDEPLTCFATVTGRHRYGMDNRCVCGSEALIRKGSLRLSYSMERGNINNSNDTASLIRHFFSELKVNPSEQPCLITEHLLNSKENRETMAEIMFQDLGVPSYYPTVTALLNFYASGMCNGVYVESGDGQTSVVSILQGYVMAMENYHFAGKDVNDHLRNLLMNIGHYLNNPAQLQIVREIKQKLCYVALDYQSEISNFSNAKKKDYELPDGQIISLGTQLFRCPEVLFNPNLIYKQMPGLHEMCYKSIQKCDEEFQKRQLYKNIRISGGSTMFPGLPERLNKQIAALAPPETQVNVHAPADRKWSTWKGASILSSLSTFQSMWITKKEYQECGPSIVHNKCSYKIF